MGLLKASSQTAPSGALVGRAVGSASEHRKPAGTRDVTTTNVSVAMRVGDEQKEQDDG